MASRKPKALKNQWQFVELSTADEMEFPDFDLLMNRWGSVGPGSAQKVAEAWINFNSGEEDPSFTFTMALGGTYKWIVKRTQGYNMIAHHCKKDYVALWLKPMNELELAGHLIKQSLGYQMVVSHPHTGLEYFRIDEVEKSSWAFCLEEIGRRAKNMMLCTNQETDKVNFIYKHNYQVKSKESVVRTEIPRHDVAATSARRASSSDVPKKKARNGK